MGHSILGGGYTYGIEFFLFLWACKEFHVFLLCYYIDFWYWQALIKCILGNSTLWVHELSPRTEIFRKIMNSLNKFDDLGLLCLILDCYLIGN